MESPPGPPPLLSEEQLIHLAQQGWLQLPLKNTLLQHVRDLAQSAFAFFEQGAEHKQDLYPASQGTENGFYHVPSEKEYITFRHRVHHSSKLEQEVAFLWNEIAALLYRILCDFARGLDLPETMWDGFLHDSLALPASRDSLETTTTLMRLFRYYASSGFAPQHVDIGILTLCISDGKGLQVLDISHKPPQWVDAQGPIVVVGETLRLLVGNKIRCGLHRVMPNKGGRSSVVFALRPSLKEPFDLATCGVQGQVDTKELWARIKASKYNINATKDIRERQRDARG